jgi:hypothetical protein
MNTLNLKYIIIFALSGVLLIGSHSASAFGRFGRVTLDQSVRMAKKYLTEQCKSITVDDSRETILGHSCKDGSTPFSSNVKVYYDGFLFKQVNQISIYYHNRGVFPLLQNHYTGNTLKYELFEAYSCENILDIRACEETYIDRKNQVFHTIGITEIKNGLIFFHNIS